jgi:hypothetical protein
MFSLLLHAEGDDSRDDYIVKPVVKALEMLTALVKSKRELSLPAI